VRVCAHGAPASTAASQRCRGASIITPRADVRVVPLCSLRLHDQSLLSCEDLADVPFLILGNKIDLGRAASEDELRGQLGLHQSTTGKGKVALNGIRPMELFMCSVVRKSGYGDGFRWLSNYIK
jgi:GTPase SAR1 family protein